MSEHVKINDEVTVGGQPSPEEIQQLGEDGFGSVVNFRTEAEDAQQLSPDEEKETVESSGMKYLHIPVSMSTLSPVVVDQFRNAYANLPKPVFAHCKGGTRAGAMVMMQMAVDEGLTGDQALQKLEAAGFRLGNPAFRSFLKEYVDSQNPASDA